MMIRALARLWCIDFLNYVLGKSAENADFSSVIFDLS